MRKILILANALGGLYTFRRELIAELLREGYEVIISAPQGKKAAFFTGMGCRFIETPVKRRKMGFLQDLKLFFIYKRIIRSLSPDIVLTYTIKPNIYGGIACSRLHIPYIANITGLGSALEKKGLLRRLTLSLYRKALKDAHCVFFQNRSNKQFMEDRKVFGGKHRLIPGSGVNLEHFTLMEYPPQGTLNFLFVSRVMKENGIEEYLAAAQEIRARHCDTVFHVVGICEEDYRDWLQGLEEKGVIQFHGPQEDVREFYRISHCTVYPTYYPEGMSNVLLESAACGRPVITTDRPGCREAVVDGVSGFLVREKDTTDLVEKLEAFIGLPYDEKKTMGLAGRAKVKVEFDRQIVVDAYLKEIGHCLGRRG